MKVDYDGEVFVVEAGPRYTDRMRQIPGSRWQQKHQVWHVPAQPAQMWIMGDVLKGKLEPTEAAAAKVKALTDFCKTQNMTRTALIYGAGNKLFPFQKNGVSFLLGGRGVLLADEMGTGKTVQALVALKEAGAHRTLVVCTKSMMHKWASEAEIWFPEATPVVIEGNRAQRERAIFKAQDADGPSIGIINWESLRLHTKLAPFGATRSEGDEGVLNWITWDSVVADEAHRAKDPKAKQTRALWYVSRDSTRRYALTGTPIANSPDDLWSIMHFVSPDEWPSRTSFRDRFCLMYANPHGGYENLGLRQESEPLLRKFLMPRFIRRTKAEVLPDLPDKLYDYRTVPMHKDQAKVYKDLAEQMIAEVKGGLLTVTDPLVLIGRLRMAASAMLDVGDESVALSLPSNKVEALAEIVDEMAGSPLVVFAESRKLIELAAREMEAAGLRVGMVTGQVTGSARQEVVDSFQDGRLDMVLCTTGAGGEGITLTRADTLVFLQLDWSNIRNKQAEDRIHRIGQKNAARIITLLSEATVDQHVLFSAMTKEEIMQEIVQDPKRVAYGA